MSANYRKLLYKATFHVYQIDRRKKKKKRKKEKKKKKNRVDQDTNL